MRYCITFVRQFDMKFQGDGRQFVIKETKTFMLREVPIEHLPLVIESIVNQQCRLISIGEEDSGQF